MKVVNVKKLVTGTKNLQLFGKQNLSELTFNQMRYSMISKMFMILMLLTVQPVLAARNGGESGGGGGAYKLDNGTVVTLPEFGVLLKDNGPSVTEKKFPKYFHASNQVKIELEKINAHFFKLMAFEGIKISEILPVTNGTIFVQSEIDAELYSKIKAEYKKITMAFGYKFEDEKFILPAVTSEGKTYILPDFDLLSPTRQAKILIHETSMRKKLEEVSNKNKARLIRLQKALTLDSAIEKMLTLDEKSFELQPTLMALASLRFIDETQVFRSIFRSMLLEAGKPIPGINLLRRTNYAAEADPVDPSLFQEIQEKYNLKTNYAEMFEGTTLFASAAFTFAREKENFYNTEAIQLCSSALITDDSPNRVFFIHKNEVKFIWCGDGNDQAIMIRPEVSLAGPFIKSFFN